LGVAKFLTAQEVAERYLLDIQRVYAATREGLIPCVRIGRQIRYDLEQLKEWEKRGGTPYPGGWRKEA